MLIPTYFKLKTFLFSSSTKGIFYKSNIFLTLQRFLRMRNIVTPTNQFFAHKKKIKIQISIINFQIKKMRVRFAPSPTGALHIGGVRTALYNYLLAQKHGGTFILRIEDTDQERYVPGAEDYIVEALQWLGLEFDESPAKGGPYAPYRQSERKATGIYEKFAKQLVANGHGYYAFDTKAELDLVRQAVEAKGGNFKYDANTRLQLKNSLTLPEATWKKMLADGEPYVIRMMIPDTDENVVFNDLVRGVVEFDCKVLDDKVMLKEDGMPTYHLANIVDDYDMKITHVIRGEEWLPSTPSHVLLYRFLGWESAMPQFAHLPLILKPDPSAYLNKKSVEPFTTRFTGDFLKKNPIYTDKKEDVSKNILPILQDFKSIAERLKINDKKDSKLQQEIKSFLHSTMYGKLSKRDGDRLGMPVFPLDWNGEKEDDHFKGFREWGFLPEAVINLLALLGWNDGTDQEIYTREELIQAFTLERVSPSGAKFSFEKANWFNKQYLGHLSNEKLTDLVKPILKNKGVNIAADKLDLVVTLLKPRISYLTDFYPNAEYFFHNLDLNAVKTKHEHAFQTKILDKWTQERVAELNELLKNIEAVNPFDATTLESVVEPLMADKKGDILPILRLGLSGETGGAGVYEIMEVLGKEESIKRLLKFIEFCNK